MVRNVYVGVEVETGLIDNVLSLMMLVSHQTAFPTASVLV